MTPALDRRVVDRAVTAWLRARSGADSDETVGTFFGDSADTIITAVAPWPSPLYYAYERAVRKSAQSKRTRKPRAPRRQRRPMSDIERARIAAQLRAGACPKQIAAEFNRGIASVYEIRRKECA